MNQLTLNERFRSAYSCLFIVVTAFVYGDALGQQKSGFSVNQRQAVQFIEARKTLLSAWSDSIWRYAEPSLKEIRSSQMIIDILREEGFRLQENVSGFASVFIATYGSGKPVVGLYGEYDADPNASNKVVPMRDEISPGAYGHGGSHNLLGTGSLGAALAIKDLIKRGRLKATIRYYGTTAEGGIGSKTFLARDGYFNDLDLSLYWHPSPATWASTRSWDALIDLEIALSSRKINVMQDNTGELNGLDALEFMVEQLHRLRLKNSSGIKLNYAISSRKVSPNQTPDTTQITVRIQCAKQADALSLFQEIKKATSAVSDQTKVEGKLRVVKAFHQFLPNVTAMQVVQRNMEHLGVIPYSGEEQGFTKELQRYLKISPDGILDKIAPFSDQSQKEQLYGYGSDIGDVSWIAPEIYFVVKCLPGVPMHQWPGTVFSGHSIGHKGMIQASKVLALTIVEYLENIELQKHIRDDFEKNRQTYRYQSLLPADASINPSVKQ